MDTDIHRQINLQSSSSNRIPSVFIRVHLWLILFLSVSDPLRFKSSPGQHRTRVFARLFGYMFAREHSGDFFDLFGGG